MKKLNKKILVITIALLAVALLATPVMAKSSKMIPVTYVRNGFTFTDGKSWTTEGNTYHTVGASVGFSDYQILIDNVVFLAGTSSGTAIQNMKIDTILPTGSPAGNGNQHFESTLIFPGGTFEGQINTKGRFVLISSGPLTGYMYGLDFSMKAVWHGTGAYNGWTLVLESATGQPTVGYILIP